MNQENNKPRVVLHDKTFELSIPYAKLNDAITALGDKINEDYKDVETPLFLGVLNGAFMFMSELMPVCMKVESPMTATQLRM